MTATATLTKLPRTGYMVDLSTVRFETRPHPASDFEERFGTPSHILVTMMADAVRADGSRWPCVVGLYSGLPKQKKAIMSRLSKDLDQLKAA